MKHAEMLRIKPYSIWQLALHDRTEKRCRRRSE